MSPSKSKTRRLKAAKVGRQSRLAAGSSSSQAHVPWTLPPTSSSSTCYVFRSVVTGKTWDQFEPLHASSSSANLSAGFLLRSCGSSTATVSHKDHINMGWNHSIRSPYISFSTDLEWVIYYQLKHSHIYKSNPSRARHLYALEVLADDVQIVSATDPRAKSNAKTAKEMLGTLQVRVVRHLSLMDLIPPVLRDMSLDWFGRQKRFAKLMSIPVKYPFLEWRGYVRLNYQQALDTMACAVDAWKAAVPAVQPIKSVQGQPGLQGGMQSARNNSTSHKNHSVSELFAPVMSPPTPRLPVSTTPLTTLTDHLSISIPPAAHSRAATQAVTGTSAAVNSPSSSSRPKATEATPLLGVNHLLTDRLADTSRLPAAISSHTALSIASNRINYGVSREARALQALHAQYLPQHQFRAETPLAEPASRSMLQIVKGTVWDLLCWVWDRLKVLVRGNEMRAEEASLA